MFSEIHYNKIQIYVIKIFEMTHPIILQAIKNKWRIKNLYFKNWRNVHSDYFMFIYLYFYFNTTTLILNNHF